MLDPSALYDDTGLHEQKGLVHLERQRALNKSKNTSYCFLMHFQMIFFHDAESKMKPGKFNIHDFNFPLQLMETMPHASCSWGMIQFIS